MATRKEIAAAVLKACKAIAPSVTWSAALTGANRSNVVEGTISCDAVDFKFVAKDKQHATANYNVFVAMMQGTTDVDAIVDDLFEVFNGTNMGGLCYKVTIKRIVYGSVQGFNSSKIAKMEMDIEYPV